MTAFNGYPISVFLAVLLHAVIIGSLFWVQRASTAEVIDVVRPPTVKAVLVQENPQARNERVQQQQQLDQQRAEEQRRQEDQRRQEQEREAQQERERQARLEEERRQATLREQREREQQEAEQRRREEERRQEEERRRQEEQRRQEEDRQRQEAEAERQRQEQARIQQEATERAETDAEIVASYTSIIHDLVQQHWSRPPSARNNMEAVLRIRLLPTGDLVNVEIVRSSGDDAFDRAAENAVRAVGRFSELQGMPPRLFDRSFRSLLLTFRPEDLRN